MNFGVNGNTAFRVALSRNLPGRVIKALSAAGASGNQKTAEGKTMLDLLFQRQDEQTEGVLCFQRSGFDASKLQGAAAEFVKSTTYKQIVEKSKHTTDSGKSEKQTDAKDAKSVSKSSSGSAKWFVMAGLVSAVGAIAAFKLIKKE